MSRRLKTAVLIACVLAFTCAGSPSLALDLCGQLHIVLKGADSDYMGVRGKYGEVPSSLILSSDKGWLSKLVLPGFDICVIDDGESAKFYCRGADQMSGDDELTGQFADIDNKITACLGSKIGRARGWRMTTAENHFGDGMQRIWTNGGKYDASGRETHIVLKIEKHPNSELNILQIKIQRY